MFLLTQIKGHGLFTNHELGVMTHDSSQKKGYGIISLMNQVLVESNNSEWIIKEL